MRRLLLALSLSLLMVLPAQAGAVNVVLGPPVLSASDSFASCDALSPNFCTAKTFIPTSLPEPGATLVTPADGTIISWRVKGAPPAKLRLRIVKAAGGGQFTGVATSGIAKVSDGVSDNPAAIGISAGSQIGVNVENVALNSFPTTLGNLNAPGAAWSAWSPGLADSSTSAPTASGSGSEPLVNATVVLAKPLVFDLTSTSGPETGGEIVVVNGFHMAIATGVTFDGIPAQILAAANNQAMVLTPPRAPGTVNVAITTAGGTSDESAATRYTYNAVPPPPPDTKAPVLSAFSIAPLSFKAKAGATISFKSSEAASVKFTVLKKPANNHGRFKALPGSFSQQATAGANKLHFDARLKGKRLKPGRYRLAAVATDVAGNRANALKRTFKVLP
jgi:hypothetical protein